MAEEWFGDAVASIIVEVLENLFHLWEHFGTTEFGDNEVIGKEGITEWAILKGGVGVEKELECKGWVFLRSEEGGESEWRYGF